MNAVDQLLIQHLDLWASAIKRKAAAGRGSSNKIELYGIKKLRELILELAVRGLLVPQDPNDEPASELLKKIVAEKARLVKEGKIKRERPLPAIDGNDAPFPLPEGWALARLGDVINVLNGRAYKKPEMLSEGTPLLRVGNLFTSNEWYYSDLELEPEKYIDDGDLIYAWSASFGPFIWQGGKVIYHYHIWKMDFFSKSHVDKFFFRNYLEAISASIKASGNGIAMIHMTKERMEKLVLPIPPLAEQHRIVGKVDELMALCDQLEQQAGVNLRAHQTLVETLLNILTSASDYAQFASAWKRIANHFDTLFTTEQSIDRLQQAILDLAVMGKLVPQDGKDEPSSELLKKIAGEKGKLVKEGKIRKEKPLPAIADGVTPLGLPSGWRCASLQELTALVTDGDHQAPPKADSGVPFLVIGNLNKGIVDFSDCKYVPETYYENLDWGRRPCSLDLLYTVTGSYGIPVVINSDSRFCVQRHVAILKSTNSTPVAYLYLFLKSTFAFNYASSIATGIAQKTVPLSGLRAMPVTLPPLAEQHRIVAKVDTLMALCDQLKARLCDAQVTQLHLADAVAEKALAGA
ncbi:restriction endonuclease subunit S [Paraburkholderia nodosa]|uniref:restriction endonuclease subunit S n=1 Tax=Paraburkholderia nodosa TaxID=392320 RepID=UPI0009F5DCDC|nr:restriction endonuclease subunit S [Paraburkholderia nodosa]